MINSSIFPLLLLEDDMYDAAKKYLIEKSSSKDLEEALQNSSSIRSAIRLYKDITCTKMKDYSDIKSREIIENDIMDRLIINRFSKNRRYSVKRTMEFENKDKRKRKKRKSCIFFKQGY